MIRLFPLAPPLRRRRRSIKSKSMPAPKVATTIDQMNLFPETKLPVYGGEKPGEAVRNDFGPAKPLLIRTRRSLTRATL